MAGCCSQGMTLLRCKAYTLFWPGAFGKDCLRRLLGLTKQIQLPDTLGI